MSIIYFENGVQKCIEKYDPLPDYDREERRSKKYYRRSEGLPRGWW